MNAQTGESETAGKRRKKKTDYVREWTERDLSAEAAAGKLPAVYEIDDVVRQVEEIIASDRNPVLVGPPGIGKTAAVYALVQRVCAGQGPDRLDGTRILQCSFEHRVSAIGRYGLSHDFYEFAKRLAHHETDIVPFFPDLDVAAALKLGRTLLYLAHEMRRPILCEGGAYAVEWLFAEHPELDQHFVVFELREPIPEKSTAIARAWNEARKQRKAKAFTDEAVDYAIHLTHRFLTRTYLPGKALALLDQTAGISSAKTLIERAEVVDRFCRRHQVPRLLVDPEVPLDINALRRRFASRVLGQQEATEAVVRMISMTKAGLSDDRRPLGTFLFVGPTGVGKTHIAQYLAEELFGSRDRMIRINMAELQHPSEGETPKLMGPQGILTRGLRRHAFAVVLLDEFEKAEPEVHDALLQLIDEGCVHFEDEVLSCRSTVIIATSNTGAEVYRGKSMGFADPDDLEVADREVDRQLRERFRFEFLNRFDQIVHFHPLTREHIRRIAQRELQQLEDRSGLRIRSLRLEVDETVLDWLVINGYDPYHGARFLRRTIERHVATAVAEAIVRHDPAPGSTISLTVQGGTIRARAAAKDAPAPREAITLPSGQTRHTRKLDDAALLTEARRVWEDASGLLEDLDAQRQERSRLLETMNEPDFWSDVERSRELLERFRKLDVVVQMGDRFARPIRSLHQRIPPDAVPGQPALVRDRTVLARSLEQAAAALHEWRRRFAVLGPDGLWLVLSRADPLGPSGSWIRELVELECAWCRGLGLAAGVAAYGQKGRGLARVALEVEGPGALDCLAMEHGEHRYARKHNADLRVFMDVVPRSAMGDVTWDDIEDVRPSKGLWDIRVTCCGRIRRPARGLTVEFLGDHRETLVHLLHDLDGWWKDEAADSRPVARVYNATDAGVHDPRTGAVVANTKAVLKGQLQPFLDAWHRSAVPR